MTADQRNTPDHDPLDRQAASAGGSRDGDLAARHADAPTVGDEVGEAAGGVAGVVAGAAIGSPGGPIGIIIGGIAGAVGGWWAGRAIGEAATRYTASDDGYYRNHYETADTRLADRSYDDVRPAYQLGHLAGHNPEYSGRTFDEIEPDLKRGWDSNTSAAHGEWAQVRGYAHDAYARASGSPEARRAREEASNAGEEDDRRLDESAGVRYF